MRNIIKLLIIVFLFGNFHLEAQQETVNDISKAAENSLTEILNKIPLAQEKQFGFNNRAEFKNAKIGKPLEFLWYSDIDNNARVWRVPIVVNGEYRALLNIGMENDKLRIMDFGAAVLAKDIQLAINKNANKNITGILRFSTITSDFLIVKNIDSEEYIPLTSAKLFIESKGLKSRSTYKSSELIEFLNKK